MPVFLVWPSSIALLIQFRHVAGQSAFRPPAPALPCQKSANFRASRSMLTGSIPSSAANLCHSFGNVQSAANRAP